MAFHRTIALPWTLVLFLSTVCCVAGRSDPHQGLEPDGPKEIFRSDGGSLVVWSSNYRAIQDASVGADRMTLEPRGLGLLKYSDSAHLAYVLEGKGYVGLSYPFDESAKIRRVEQGDMIAIPRGVGNWWFNDGDKRCVILRVYDTSRKENSRGEYDSFFLTGGSTNEWRSVLHGFAEELLTQAWDVDKDVVRQITKSQKGAVIVKVDDDFEIPEELRHGDKSQIWEKFTYNIDNAEPDLDVKHGGSLSILTSKQLAILREVRLGAIRVRLNPEAMFAPSYGLNGHTLVYVTQGSGLIQVVGPNGQIMASDVKAGSLVVVPQFYPDIKKAGKDGLEYIAITTSDMPIFSFLAGKNALDRGVPVEVLAAGNNVPVDVQQKILDRRQNDVVIFPRRQSSASVTEAVIEKLSGMLLPNFEELKGRI